mmetsp:Transcript_6378/g.15780  ORF Transcript_6378/g.15780 Transcript_6378/m.15780 type:complete len:226 (+) Transcript_6378:207-884(+)|eukprot:g9201.t1
MADTPSSIPSRLLTPEDHSQTKTATDVRTTGFTLRGDIDLMLHVLATRVEDREDDKPISALLPVSQISLLVMLKEAISKKPSSNNPPSAGARGTNTNKRHKGAQLVTVHADNGDRVMRAQTDDENKNSYYSEQSSVSHRLVAAALLHLHPMVYPSSREDVESMGEEKGEEGSGVVVSQVLEVDTESRCVVLSMEREGGKRGTQVLRFNGKFYLEGETWVAHEEVQ